MQLAHPSFLNVLASSQSSPGSMMPFKQVGRHTSKPTPVPARLQNQPISTSQVGLQPSPGSVLLSSQSSSPTRRPSPQIGTQGVSKTEGHPCVGHVKPASMLQCLEQPSPSIKFPSSHSSPATTCRMPSPHTTLQLSAVNVMKRLVSAATTPTQPVSMPNLPWYSQT